MSPRFQWISNNSSQKSLDVRAIYSDFAIRIEGEGLMDVVVQDPKACLPPSWQGEFHKVLTKNGIYRHIAPSINTIIV